MGADSGRAVWDLCPLATHSAWAAGQPLEPQADEPLAAAASGPRVTLPRAHCPCQPMRPGVTAFEGTGHHERQAPELCHSATPAPCVCACPPHLQPWLQCPGLWPLLTHPALDTGLHLYSLCTRLGRLSSTPHLLLQPGRLPCPALPGVAGTSAVPQGTLLGRCQERLEREVEGC